MSDNNFRKGPHASKSKPKAADVVEIDNAVSSVDERKTVILDEDLDGVDFEDRVWLYWKRNKSFIVLTVLAMFAIVIGVQSWKMYNINKRAQLAEEYAAAGTPVELAKFAADNAGSALAGVALIQTADNDYAAGKYADAKKLYKDAGADLAGNVLLGRAKLGFAASVYAENAEAGIAELKSVYDDASIDGAYRAQAGYLLAIGYELAGKAEDAKSILKAIAGNPKNGYFARIAEDKLSKL